MPTLKPKNEIPQPSICILTLAYPSQANPSHGHFIEKQAQILYKLGHSLVVVAPRTYYADSFLTKNNGICVYRFPYLSGNKRFSDYHRIPFLTLMTFFFSGFWQALKVAKKKKCPIILAHWVVPTGVIGFFVSTILKKKLVVTVHGSDINVYTEKSRLAFWLAKLTFQKSSIIIAASSDLKKKICQKFLIEKEKIKVIPIGIDLELFSPQPKNKARKVLKVPQKLKIILFSGGLAEVKGFEVLIKALPEVVKSMSKVVCVVLGKIETKKLKALKNQLEEKRLENKVIFIGAVSPKKMPLWLNMADLVVIPSLSEGLGLIAIEALSCNTPIIASATGELPQIIKKTNGGFLFKPGNYRELSQKITKLLKERKNRFKINRQFLKENYNLTENAKQLSDFLKQLVFTEPLYGPDYYNKLKK